MLDIPKTKSGMISLNMIVPKGFLFRVVYEMEKREKFV